METGGCSSRSGTHKGSVVFTCEFCPSEGRFCTRVAGSQIQQCVAGMRAVLPCGRYVCSTHVRQLCVQYSRGTSADACSTPVGPAVTLKYSRVAGMRAVLLCGRYACGTPVWQLCVQYSRAASMRAVLPCGSYVCSTHVRQVRLQYSRVAGSQIQQCVAGMRAVLPCGSYVCSTPVWQLCVQYSRAASMRAELTCSRHVCSTHMRQVLVQYSQNCVLAQHTETACPHMKQVLVWKGHQQQVLLWDRYACSTHVRQAELELRSLLHLDEDGDEAFVLLPEPRLLLPRRRRRPCTFPRGAAP